MKNLLLVLLFSTPFVNFSQDCPTFSAEANGKPVKVTFYTESDQCFSLSGDGKTLNTSPSKRVVFYMDYGVVNTKIKLANGKELDKKVMAGNTLAAVTMEIVYNAKKDEWDVKNRLGQGAVNDEEQQKRDAATAAMNQKMKDDQAARDKEWDEKRAAEKVEREKAKESEEPKYSIQKVDTKVNTDIQKVDTKLSTPASEGSVTKSTSGEMSQPAPSSEVKAEVKKDVPPGYPYGFQFVYNNKPIKNQVFVVVSNDSNKKELMRATSDEKGIAVFYTELPMGKYDVQFVMEFDGALHPNGVYSSINLGNTVNYALVFDYTKYVESYQKMSKDSTTAVEKRYGLDKVNF